MPFPPVGPGIEGILDDFDIVIPIGITALIALLLAL
jgi:hypothetical protein